MTSYNARDIIANLPNYVPGQLIADIKASYGLDKIVKLASNENPFGPAVSLAEIAQSIDVDRYPDPDSKALKKRLAETYNLTSDHILCGNGSDELMQILALAFLDKSSNIITADLTFSEYEFVATLMGAKTIKVPVKDNSYDLDGLLSAITTDSKLIFIANPNNPTGTLLSHDELESFIKQVPKEVLIVLDEAYIEYATQADTPRSTELLNRYSNVVVLRTFSKLYGLAGCRIGYAMANPKLIQILNRVKQPFNVNALAAEAAYQALEAKDFIKRSLEGNKAGKERLCTYLSQKGLNFQPTEANFIYVDLKRDAKTFCQKSLEKGLILRPLSSFGRPEAIRITIGTNDELDFLESIMEALLHE